MKSDYQTGMLFSCQNTIFLPKCYFQIFLRTLVASLALQQVKEVGASAMKHDTNNVHNCTPQLYILLPLSASIFGLVIFAILHVRRIKLCRGQLFSNAVKIMISISDIQYYVLI